VERALARRGFARRAAETPREFAVRVQTAAPPPEWTRELALLVEAYYRALFDPLEPAASGEAFVAAADGFLELLAAPRPGLAAARG
jgi:hypothetical protein